MPSNPPRMHGPNARIAQFAPPSSVPQYRDDLDGIIVRTYYGKDGLNGTPERIVSVSKKSKISISTLLIGKGASSTQAPRKADVNLNGVTVDEDAALDAELQALLDAAGTDDDAESEASSTDLDEMEVSPPSSPEFPFGILLPAADQHSTAAAGPSSSANHHTQGDASADTRHFEASIAAHLGPKPRNIIDLTHG